MVVTPAAGGLRRAPLRVVLLVDKAVETGGAERFAMGLAMNLPRDRVQPWVCSTRLADPETVASLADLGIPHLHLGRQSKWDVHRLWPLLALLRRERIDVIHSHMFGSNLWGTLLGRAAGVPVILPQEHGWSYSDNPLRTLLDGQVIGRLATRFVTVSAPSQQRMISVEHVAASKVMVMPTAYIPRASGAVDLRAELGLAADTPLIGVASILRPEKALGVMLDAHRQVVDRIPDAHLVIAGEGECLPALRRHAITLGLKDRVHFLGMRQDVDGLLRQVDVGAMSSDREGMPLFALECMAAGTALVATAVGGLQDLIENGETGLLVAPGDPRALGDALASVLRDRTLRERLGKAALQRLDEFRIETVAGRFADLYAELLTLADSER
jgi:glycosyltransferase involved in cell wall biosynthesis